MNVENPNNRRVAVDGMHQQHPSLHPYDPSAPPPTMSGAVDGMYQQHPSHHPYDPSASPPAIAGVYPSVYLHSGIHVTGYAVPQPPRPPPLPFCGIGVGWFLFILGWFVCGIPWYVGATILICSKVDPRERPGYIGCTIFAIVISVVAVVMAAKGKS